MSATKDPAAKGAVTRSYVVVRVDGNTHLIMGSTMARRPEEAMDIVVSTLPPAERTGTYGAFTANSYREQDFVTAQEWKTEKKPRTPSFKADEPTESENEVAS